jgi:hypothetical protein
LVALLSKGQISMPTEATCPQLTDKQLLRRLIQSAKTQSVIKTFRPENSAHFVVDGWMADKALAPNLRWAESS